MATLVTKARPATVSPLKRLLSGHPLSAYFILAFALTWIPILPLTLSRNAGIGLLPYDLPDILMYVLLTLTTFSGPTLAALIVTGATEGRAGVKQFLKRFIQWRVRPHWYIVVLGINLLVWLLAYTALVGPQLFVAAVTHWSLLLTTFVPLVVFGIIIPDRRRARLAWLCPAATSAALWATLGERDPGHAARALAHPGRIHRIVWPRFRSLTSCRSF